MDKLERLEGSTNIKDFPEIYNNNISKLQTEIGRLNDLLSEKNYEIKKLKEDFNSALNKLRAEYTQMIDKLKTE